MFSKKQEDRSKRQVKVYKRQVKIFFESANCMVSSYKMQMHH